MVLPGIAIHVELEPTEPISEKCSHRLEKGEVLTEIWHTCIRIGCPVQHVDLYVLKFSILNLVRRRKIVFTI